MNDLYRKAWSLLSKVTPLRNDCGSLCDKKCCQGVETEGMLLYPGEEKLFIERDSWYTVRESAIVLESGRRIMHLSCNGTCIRDERPLACRIFPLMPYLTDEGLLEIRADYRAAGMCPLLNMEIDPLFIDSLYDAFAVLIESSEIVAFIEILSSSYDDMESIVIV